MISIKKIEIIDLYKDMALKDDVRPFQETRTRLINKYGYSEYREMFKEAVKLIFQEL